MGREISAGTDSNASPEFDAARNRPRLGEQAPGRCNPQSGVGQYLPARRLDHSQPAAGSRDRYGTQVAIRSDAAASIGIAVVRRVFMRALTGPDREAGAVTFDQFGCSPRPRASAATLASPNAPDTTSSNEKPWHTETSITTSLNDPATPAVPASPPGRFILCVS